MKYNIMIFLIFFFKMTKQTAQTDNFVIRLEKPESLAKNLPNELNIKTVFEG